MKTFRHPWLALFLIFCLPAQALAAVLAECEQHIAESHAGAVTRSANHHEQIASVTPDCHGTSVSRESAEPAVALADLSQATDSINNPDDNSCFHCSGACQSFKPLSLIAKTQQTQIFDNGAFSRLSPATETGVHSTPARPPCPLVLS